jgi:hypothetical protein
MPPSGTGETVTINLRALEKGLGFIISLKLHILYTDQYREMFLCVLLLVSLGTAQVDSPAPQTAPQLPTFEEFLAKFNLTFPEEELPARRSIYAGNVTRLRENPCEWCGVTPFFASTSK